MMTRSEKQFIGFMLLTTAFNGWSWLVLKAPLTLLSHVNETAYRGKLGWMQGHSLLGMIQQLVNNLAILSEIGAVVLIGICFLWLAYQSIYFPGSLPIRNQTGCSSK